MSPFPDDLDAGLLPSTDPTCQPEARLIEPVLGAIRIAVDTGSITAAQAFAGRIYRRKTTNDLTPFGASPDGTYGSADDDVYLELGVRVPSSAASPVRDAIRAVEATVLDQRLWDAHLRLEQARRRTASSQQDEARIRDEMVRLFGSLP
ncbi:hypothetical protein [Granulicoccus phenolivorans]|uniref:hypothetical protein n=1 Tax=Granulicoccus phenolivorans TaxID=266854 RepID=UPI000428DEA2|nr:hypothetical protein [Granulicoccus phenolivorans]